MPFNSNNDKVLEEDIFYECEEEFFYDCFETFVGEPETKKRPLSVDEEEEKSQPAQKKVLTEEVWKSHLADMHQAFNSYTVNMHEAQDIFEAALSSPSQQDASMNARLKRKRSSTSVELEEVELPARKKRCLEDVAVFPASALRYDPQYGQAHFLLNPMSPEATASDSETFDEDNSLFDI